MRNIPIDSSRITLIGTGKAAERAEYIELSDGSRKRSGNQAKGKDSGLPVWVVDVVVDDDSQDRAETIGVVIEQHEPPVTVKWQPVVFVNLRGVMYRDNATGEPRMSLRADGIVAASARSSAA